MQYKIYITSIILQLFFVVTGNCQPWNQLGEDIIGEAQDDNSGCSVSINGSGNVVAIGADHNNGNGITAGHVRIYQWNKGSWSQLGSDIEGEAAGDFTGCSVSLSDSGTTVAIGAWGNDAADTEEGHVRVYQWNNNTSDWVIKGQDIDGESAGDRSGAAVSLSADGNVVAIGAYYNDGEEGSSIGHTRIYEWQNSSWVQRGEDINGSDNGDLSGWSVSLNSNGNIVAIGSPEHSTSKNLRTGQVRVFEWKSNTWQQLGGDIDGIMDEERAGKSVCISDDGKTLVLGAYRNSTNGIDAGQVRVYALNNNSVLDWEQLGNSINGEAAFDHFGISVSLNSKGTILAAGAILNDVDSGNGSDIGSVRVYELNNNNWEQIEGDIDGEGKYDEFGYSLSLNNKGDRLAVGAPYNDANGWNAGEVKIFSYSSASTGYINYQNKNENNINIHPNPCSNHLCIQTTLENDFTYSVYSVSGNKKIEANSNQAEVNMTTQTLKPGIYFLKIIDTKKGITLKRFIKN